VANSYMYVTRNIHAWDIILQRCDVLNERSWCLQKENGCRWYKENNWIELNNNNFNSISFFLCLDPNRNQSKNDVVYNINYESRTNLKKTRVWFYVYPLCHFHTTKYTSVPTYIFTTRSTPVINTFTCCITFSIMYTYTTIRTRVRIAWILWNYIILIEWNLFKPNLLVINFRIDRYSVYTG